jgi:sn-glycerol 3-phosphate transport system substrate-binding protein
VQSPPARSILGCRRREGARQSLVIGTISVVAISALALLVGAADAQAKTEIQFWHAMQGARGEALETLVKQFNESQGEFEVKAVYKGTYPEVQKSAMAAYRQKSAPHIVQAHDAATLSMILSDAIVPVYRLMKQQQVAVNWDDFIETITGYYSKDGRLYSMPFNVSTAILYYNKDTFRKAGLGDKPPASWQDVETVSRKILASGAAKCGFTTGGSPSWDLLENIFPWHDQPFATNQNGYTGLDTRLLINSNFGRMHVGALARWHQEGLFISGGWEGKSERFINGDCAMIVEESGTIGNFKQTLKFDWGTGQLPHWGPPYAKANTILGGTTLWVMRGREPADYRGVAQFMKFIVEPHQQMWWAVTTGFVPITRTAFKSLEDSGFYKQNPEQWTAMGELLNAKATVNSRGLRLGNYVRVREAIEQELENIYAGKKTVKEGLDAAVLRGNAILREFSVSNGAAPQGEI